MVKPSPDVRSIERGICSARETMLARYADYVRALDEDADWATVAAQARKAGIPKDWLVAEIACSWSTFTRWVAGQCEPGPATKRTFKARIVEKLVEMAAEERRDADALGGGLAARTKVACVGGTGRFTPWGAWASQRVTFAPQATPKDGQAPAVAAE